MNYHKRKITLGEVYPLLTVFAQDGKEPAERSLLCRHTSVEITCVVSGSSVCHVSDREYKIETGDALMFSPGEKHKIELNENLHLLTMHFEPRLIWNMGADFPDCSLLEMFFCKNDKFQNLIKSSHPASAQILRLVRMIKAELDEKGKEYALAAKIYTAEILIIILKSFDYTGRIIHAASRNYTIDGMEKALDFIHRYPAKTDELDELAEVAELSRSHFCTVFKRYNGMSPWDYITIRRVEYAVHLLRTTALPRPRIAKRCGFGTAANLYRAFKKVTDTIPGEFE